jgi:hypothetical protein
MIRLLLILLPFTVFAQSDARWTLLPDSTVIVPFADLKTAATYRLAQNSLTRTAVLEIVALSGEVANLRIAIGHQKNATKAAQGAAALCDTDRASITTERDRWQKKAQRRGRVITILATLSVALTIATLAP